MKRQRGRRGEGGLFEAAGCRLGFSLGFIEYE